MDIAETLATNMRGLRSLRGLTQEKLGEISGINRSYVGRIEQLDVNTSLKKVQTIADALGIDPLLLFAPVSHPESAEPVSVFESASADENFYAFISLKGGTALTEVLESNEADIDAHLLAALVAAGYEGDGLIAKFTELKERLVINR